MGNKRKTFYSVSLWSAFTLILTVFNKHALNHYNAVVVFGRPPAPRESSHRATGWEFEIVTGKGAQPSDHRVKTPEWSGFPGPTRLPLWAAQNEPTWWIHETGEMNTKQSRWKWISSWKRERNVTKVVLPFCLLWWRTWQLGSLAVNATDYKRRDTLGFTWVEKKFIHLDLRHNKATRAEDKYKKCGFNWLTMYQLYLNILTTSRTVRKRQDDGI